MIDKGLIFANFENGALNFSDTCSKFLKIYLCNRFLFYDQSISLARLWNVSIISIAKQPA